MVVLLKEMRSSFSHQFDTFNLQLAINEASSLRVGAHLITEKEEYVYRCYLALGEYRIIFNEISDSPSTAICKTCTSTAPKTRCMSVNVIDNILIVALRAVKLLATVMSDPSNKEIAILQMQEWLGDSAASSNATLRFIAAILYMFDDNLKDAIKLLVPSLNMEQ